MVGKLNFLIIFKSIPKILKMEIIIVLIAWVILAWIMRNEVKLLWNKTKELWKKVKATW